MNSSREGIGFELTQKQIYPQLCTKTSTVVLISEQLEARWKSSAYKQQCAQHRPKFWRETNFEHKILKPNVNLQHTNDIEQWRAKIEREIEL